MRIRHLTWDGCINVRDLGGYPTEDGGETAYEAVVRADNLCYLSSTGWDALVGYGVRRIVDLRWRDELEEDPPHRQGVEVVHVPLFGERRGVLDPNAFDEITLDYVERRRNEYAGYLDRFRQRFARAVEAVANAPAGCVAVHCAGGVDRTGLVAALLLRLAGVSRDLVAEDYALSQRSWAPRVEEWIGRAKDERERERRRYLATVSAATMIGALEALEEAHDGVAQYLRTTGLNEETIFRARTRLRR